MMYSEILDKIDEGVNLAVIEMGVSKPDDIKVKIDDLWKKAKKKGSDKKYVEITALLILLLLDLK